ncbi:MAG: hypothetical protein ACREBV_04305 [Candidatus Zixiibacteriota bacterium]
MTKINIILPLALLALIMGCSSENQSDDNNTSANAKTAPQTPNYDSPNADPTIEQELANYEMSGIPFDLTGKPVTIAGITFTPATQWKDLGASDMKAASYTYGPLESDKEPSQLNVYYFGQGQGGTIEANAERWIKQMSMPDGSDPAKAAIQYTKDVNGMPAHVLTLYGTFNEPVGGPMSQVTTPRENYRLIGVIVEAPQGSVFFKLTGPDYTAKIMVEAFITMINQIQKASA